MHSKDVIEEYEETECFVVSRIFEKFFKFITFLNSMNFIFKMQPTVLN